MKKNNDFEFNYVAPTSEERKEIESIRNSYLGKSKKEDKLELLRKLDNKVKNLPQTFSLILGILGILIFGLGMSMILEWKIIIWGVVVSGVSLAPIILAYPVFKFSTKKLKEKYADKILHLTDELLNNKTQS